jgi:hypothetical protein
MRLQDITKAMEEAQASMSGESFQKIGSLLSLNNDIVREEIQKETSKDIKIIIDKLKKDKPISTEELKLIKLWIVGDADSYIKMENNFEDWLGEFDRLKAVLRKHEDKESSVSDLYKLQGILQDAVRVCYDIALFLESKERISKFENASRKLTDKDKDTLMKVLTGKLQSPHY